MTADRMGLPRLVCSHVYPLAFVVSNGDFICQWLREVSMALGCDDLLVRALGRLNRSCCFRMTCHSGEISAASGVMVSGAMRQRH